MADIKTHLRELSVATTIGLLNTGVQFKRQDLYEPYKFFLYAKQVITTDLSSAKNLCTQPLFTGELKDIIDNGYNLGKKIFENPHFSFSRGDQIQWLGNDTRKDDPVDITVGKYKFSLKEESFILENMGLYKLLNCYTGSNYKKRHIFSDYARIEYSKWFEVTWNEMLKYLTNHENVWRFSNLEKHKEAVISVDTNSVTLEFIHHKKCVEKRTLPKICPLSVFEKKTNVKIREEVFAKFINQNMTKNKFYNDAKKKCAIAATEGVVKELNDNLDYHAGLPRFLRIHSFEYYYAKTTATGVEIYKVPSLQAFGNEIIIESIVSSVPDTQANILTTIKNTTTGKTLVLRNECRFSHGQFNGPPEAKMYYENKGSLLVIYEAV